MRRLMRYVLAKTLWAVFLAAVALEGMLLISALYDLMSIGERWGITAATVMKCIPWLLLERASFSIPLAAAAAGAHVFSDMAVSSELVAVQSMGKDVRKLLLPLLAVGLCLAGLSFTADELGKGYGVRHIEAMAVGDAQRLLENRFRSGESIDVGGGGMRYWLTMRGNSGGKPPWVSIMYYRGESLQLAAAAELRDFRWDNGPGYHGIVLDLADMVGQEPGKGEMTLEKGRLVCRLNKGEEGVYLGNRAANRSIRGNIAARREMRRRLETIGVYTFGVMLDAGLRAGRTGTTDTGALAGFEWARHEYFETRKALLQAEAGIHTSIGLAAAPVALLILGAAFGATVKFRNRTSAFLGTVLVVILIYYPTLMGARGLIEAAVPTAWTLPLALDAVIMAVGLALWQRVPGGMR
ncbi:MAG: LptF/LptG family permease [Planctomycetes bacterium]|nr:LptF/LptG family permease [Planctomycetota bacterium]